MKCLRVLVCVCLLAAMLCLPVRAADLSLPAKSALLMDIATGTVLYEQNPHERLAPASVTKIMTLLLVMEALDSGRIRWEDTVTASEEAAAKGGSQIYLKPGETMTVTDMIKAVAVSSANDCACALAEHLAGTEAAFVEQMNQRAGELGMKDTHFVNCTGLDDDPAAKEHLTSAYDIALMSRELMKNHPDIQTYTTIWMDTVRNGAFGLSNTNKLVRFYPGATGLKTGFTAAAGYCLSATAQRQELGLIAVVMGCATSQDRFTSCKQLLDRGFAGYSLITPQLPQTSTVPVKLGTQGQVEAIPARQLQLLLSSSQKHTVTTELTLEDSVTAPVSAGQKLGTLTLKSGDQVLQQVSMVAREAVGRLSWGQLLLRALGRIFMAQP